MSWSVMENIWRWGNRRENTEWKDRRKKTEKSLVGKGNSVVAPDKRNTKTKSLKARNEDKCSERLWGSVNSSKRKLLWSHCAVCWDMDPWLSLCCRCFQMLTWGQNPDEVMNVWTWDHNWVSITDLEQVGERRKEESLQLCQI